MAVLMCKVFLVRTTQAGRVVEEIQVTARALGIQLQLLEVQEPEDYDEGICRSDQRACRGHAHLPCYYNVV